MKTTENNNQDKKMKMPDGKEKGGNGLKKAMLHNEPEGENIEQQHRQELLKATLGYPTGQASGDVDAELLARQEQEMEEAAEKRLKNKKE